MASTAVVNSRSTFDKSLRVWQDSYGLAIEANGPKTPMGSGLMSMVAGGVCSMSIGLEILEAERAASIDDVPLYVISCAKIDHITVCDIGAFESARCWLDSMPVEQMQPDLAAVARRWRIGCAAHESKRWIPAASSARSSSQSVRGCCCEWYLADAEARRIPEPYNSANYLPAQWAELLRDTKLTCVIACEQADDEIHKGVPYRSGSSAYGRRSRGSRRDNNSRQWRGLAFSLGPAAANPESGKRIFHFRECQRVGGAGQGRPARFLALLDGR